MKIIELKTWPEYFDLLISGEKNFEVRKNDHDFKVGDKLILQEWDPKTEKYTGHSTERYVKWYGLPQKINSAWWVETSPGVLQCHAGIDSTRAVIDYPLAWEVWTKRIPGLNLSIDNDRDPGAPRLVKRLTYNKKDELTNVLQTWRVEW